jgi:hypothetical protein
MEHLVLKVLEFDLSVPTAHLFVNKMCQMIPTEDKVGHMALATYLRPFGLLLPSSNETTIFPLRQVLGFFMLVAAYDVLI